MDNKKYLGFYNGIVVQNNDPDYAGKVKVWVPHISPTVYKGWLDQVAEDKRFTFLGANVSKQFTMIVEELKQILPWADIALPLTNEGATGRYNASKQYGSISDSNSFTYVSANSAYGKSTYSQNKDNIGEKPANLYEQSSTAVHDEFATTENNVNHVNPFAYQYRPSSYSNCSKGEFGIPSVGAHVWVFFREGDVNFPVVCFASYGKVDWDSIFDSKHDYPGNSENVREVIGEYNHNVDKYRSKYVLNQKGGTFEIINTDHNEKIKITHYSGSFKEFNNSVTSELATGNDQKLVLGDQYNTIKGNKNLVVNGDSDENIKGDRYVKVGNLNYTAFVKWKSEMVDSKIPDTRQLFEVMRTDDHYIVKRGEKEILKFNSTQQKKGFKPVPNDVCSYTVSAFTNTREIGGQTEAHFDNKDTSYKDGNNKDGKNYSAYDSTNIILLKKPSEDAKLSETSPSSMNGDASVDASKDILKLLTAERIKKLFECEERMGIGGSEIKSITKDKVETIGLMFNDFGSIRIDSKGKYYASEMKISNDTSFVNKTPSPLIEYVHVDSFPGGSYTVTANNSYNLLVGAGGMNLKSFGGANIGGTITNISGEQINIGSRNEINIVCDKRLNISADIISLRQKHQKQIMVDSSLGVANNVIIGGKTYMEQEVFLHHVTAPREIQVTYPSVVFARPCSGGDLKIGDATMGDFTATINSGNLDKDGAILNGATITLTKLTCINSNPNSIICTPHNHNFDNIPLTMMDSNSAVREAAHKAEVDV